MIRRSQYFAGLAVVVLLCFSSAAAAQDYKAAAGTAPVPPEISAAVRALLSPASISVIGAERPFVRDLVARGHSCSSATGDGAGRHVWTAR